VRDRALLALGFATGLRRSEIVALDAEDLTFVDQGVVLRIRSSKSDQEGAGRRLGAAFNADEGMCPVRALQRWLEIAKISEGAVFRAIARGARVLARRTNARTVERVVKAAAQRAGLDPKRFAAHSLRSGCATAMALAGEDERAIMQRLGHRTPTMSMRYVRDVRVF
jgi:integrase